MVQIKRLASSKEAPVNYDSDESIRVPRKNKLRTGVLPNCKHHGKRRLSIMELSATAHFTIRQECLRERICRIAMRNNLANVPTKIPSMIYW